MWMRAAAAVLAAVLVTTLSACTPVTPPGPHPSDSAAAHLRWGVPAKAAPKGITYQPDVRVVGGGRNAVWGASADGIMWTLDANAPGMSDVRVGDVLYASSIAAGRVASITRSGSRETVALIPVALNDVVKDGTVAIDDAFSNGDGLLAQHVDQPTVSTIPAGADLAHAAADVHPLKAIDVLPPPTSAWGVGADQSFSVNGFELSAAFAPDGLNITVAKNFKLDKSNVGADANVGLKIGVDFGLHFDRLRMRGSQTISDGRITSSSTALQGLNAITVGMSGGAASPASDNTRYRFEVPYVFEKAEPPVYGVPTVVQLKITLIVATAFTGKNATLSSSASWGVTSSAGDILKSMAISIKKSLIDSIEGLSLGPSGWLFGVGIRFLWGVGVPGLAAGPYGKLTFAIGLSNGSALGAPLVRCRGANLDISGGVGASAYFSSAGLADLFGKYGTKLQQAVGNLIKKDTLNIEAEKSFDVTRSLIHRDALIGPKGLCG